MRQLADCPALLTLDLLESSVTDEMLPDLISIRPLRSVYLTETQVTPAGCRSLLRARPELLVVGTDGRRVQLER